MTFWWGDTTKLSQIYFKIIICDELTKTFVFNKLLNVTHEHKHTRSGAGSLNIVVILSQIYYMFIKHLNMKSH